MLAGHRARKAQAAARDLVSKRAGCLCERSWQHRPSVGRPGGAGDARLEGLGTLGGLGGGLDLGGPASCFSGHLLLGGEDAQAGLGGGSGPRDRR